MSVHTLQVSAARGEITPLMQARVDTELYQAGLAIARNHIVTRYGSVTRVPGTLHRGLTRYQNRRARLLPFSFNESQVYAMEFGHQYVRFWTRNGYVQSGGSPYQIVSPYTEDMLESINVTQSGDVVYVFGGNIQPRRLIRRGETNWSFELFETADGPYMELNETATTLTPQETYAGSPSYLTSSSGDWGDVSATANGHLAYRIFNNIRSDKVTVSTTSEGSVVLHYRERPFAANAYSITAASDNPEHGDMFTQWTIEASNDGVDWVVLDSRDGETGWAGSETRYFEFTNKVVYPRWRLRFGGGGGADGINTDLAEWTLNQVGETQTPVRWDASSTNGINGGAGFKATDVGRSIRIYGSDGRWRWLEITSVESPTRFFARMYGHALPTTGPITLWRMSAFSEESGWPSFGRFFEDRLALTGVPGDPLGIWLSVIAGYDKFFTSDPAVDDDAVSIRLTGGKFSGVNWLAEAGALLVGTGISLRSITSRDQGSVLSNTNIRQRQETAVGTSHVLPVEVENVVLFIDNYRQRLYETAFSYESDGFVARELSILNEHLFTPGISQIEWLDTPHKLCVCRRDDGKLVFFAYDREQKIAGATLVDFGGEVEDITTIPGPDGADLFMIIKRGDARYVELLAPFWRSESDQPPVYAANSFVYQGTPTNQLTGLTFLNGETVGIWADGRDIGDTPVVGGVVNLPYGIEAERIVVGLRMPWTLQTLRLPNHGQNDGSGFGRKVKVLNAYIDLFESAGLEAGSVMQVDPVVFEEDAEENPDEPVPLRTGMVKLPVDDSWQNDGVFVIEGDKMYPVTVRGISLQVEGEP